MNENTMLLGAGAIAALYLFVIKPSYTAQSYNYESEQITQKASGAFYNTGHIPYHTVNHGISAAGCACQQ